MLQWFDAAPARYWAVAWTSFGLLAGVAFLPLALGLFSERWEKRGLRIFPPWLFVTVLALSFVAFRWPMWCVAEELNPDESQIIAGAITVQHDPIYWRSVDGTTHGPLDTYALLLPRLFGVPFGYGAARFVGAALMFGLIYGCYRTARAYGRETTARIVPLSAFCFLAFVTFADFAHYSSEHVPAALLTLGFFLLAHGLSDPANRKAWSWRWGLGGLVLGAVPLAKLQGAPIAACLLATASLLDLTAGGIRFPQRLRRLFLLTAGAIVPIVFTAAVLGLCGNWADAWKSYIVQNLRYAGDNHYTHLQMLQQFWSFAERGEVFYPFIVGCAVVSGLALVPALAGGKNALRLVAFALVFLLASLAAALAPGRQYHHYLLFLIAPACLLAGSLWQAGWQAAELRPAPRRDHVALLLLFAAVIIAPQVAWRNSQPHPFVGRLARYGPLAADPVAAEILRHAHRGESLAIWGWMSRYHVYTGLRQATREAHTVQQIQWTPQIDYYRARYLADLKRSLPPVFVDAVGPGNFVFEDRSLAHESFEPLRQFIAEHYRQVAEIKGSRIYVRLDRLAAP